MKQVLFFSFLLCLLLDVLGMLVYSLYRTLLDQNIVIPGAEEKRAERSLAERLLDDPGLIRKLALGTRFFLSLTVSLGTALLILSVGELTWQRVFGIGLLLAFLLPLAEILGRAPMSGRPLRYAVILAGACRFFALMFTPFYQLRCRIIPEPVSEVFTDAVTEENHLRDWVESIPENTLLEREEKQMIRSIVHFSNTMVREIMIPRVELDALDVDDSLDNAARRVLDSGHTRLPVYEDEIDNIIGVLYAKDLLQTIVEKREDSLRTLLREPLYTPESKMAGDLLSEMQSRGVHMSVVVDEYGGTSGIVCMEDIVEEIVGEIRDEYDEKEEQLIETIGEDRYSLLGRIDLEDVNELLGTHLTREAADTLAGYLYARLGHVPVTREHVREQDWIFEIEALNGKRIRRVLVYRAPTEEITEITEITVSQEIQEEENDTNGFIDRMGSESP